jgi:hypothetical protein
MPDRSKREQILRALVELWDEGSKPDGLTVHRSPARPIQSDELPALAVSMDPGSDAAERVVRLDHSPGVERIMRVRAEIRTAGADVDSLYDETDEIYVWVIEQVALDRTLDGLCEDIVEVEIGFAAGEADMTYHAQGVGFDVTYFTSEDDPTAAPEAP